MDITIDLSRILELTQYQPSELLWFFFIHGGWILLLIALLAVLFIVRLIKARKKYLASIKHNLLAIDIPKDNEQSLLAVEQIFAGLHGIKSGPTLYEKLWIGKTQQSFSLEIVSIEGYIQFLIRTPEDYRNLVEAVIYAQYPEAEINEVEDYVNMIPLDVHEINSDFNIWGTEFTFAKHSAYPIKTFKTFEHTLSQMFVDPMASLMEVMSKIGQGEQIGLQIVIAPIGDNWKEKGYAIVNDLIGAKNEADENLGGKIVNTSIGWLEKFSESIYSLWGDITEKEDRKDNMPNLIQYLTAGEKNVVEAIQNKLTKLSFGATFRIYYLAHNEAFRKGLGVSAVLGSINQFNSSDLNSFKKFKRLTTDADYFFVKRRISRIQKRLLKYYKERSREGSAEFYLSTEELATIYHFPTITVKAPLVQKVGWRKSKPPTSLPRHAEPERSYFRAPAEEEELPTETKLPIVEPAEDYTITETLPGYDFNNDFFEDKFKKVKEPKAAAEAQPQTEKLKSTTPDNLPFTD